MGPPELEAAGAHVEVLLLLPGLAGDWLAEEEQVGIAYHLGDSTIWVLKEDGDGPKLIGWEDVRGWVFGPAGSEFEVEVQEDLVLPEDSKDFTVGPWSVKIVPFLVSRDYFFIGRGGPPDRNTRDGYLGP